MSNAPALPGDFLALLRVLREHGAEFVIIGGLAVIMHGYIRATKDVDIVPDPAPENLARLWNALVALEAQPLLGDFAPEELPAMFSLQGLVEGGGNWVLHTRLGRLDLMPYVEDEDGELPYEELRSAAETVEVEEVGAPLWVASADHLIGMKQRAGRDLDLVDVTALRRAMGEEDD